MNTRLYIIEQLQQGKWTVIERGNLSYWELLEDSINKVYSDYVGDSSYRVVIYNSNVIGDFPENALQIISKELNQGLADLEKLESNYKGPYEFRDWTKHKTSGFLCSEGQAMYCDRTGIHFFKEFDEIDGSTNLYLAHDALGAFNMLDVDHYSSHWNSSSFNPDQLCASLSDAFAALIQLAKAQLINDLDSLQNKVDEQRFTPISMWHHSSGKKKGIFHLEFWKQQAHFVEYQLIRLRDRYLTYDAAADLPHTLTLSKHTDIPNIVFYHKEEQKNMERNNDSFRRLNDHILYFENGEDRFIGVPKSKFPVTNQEKTVWPDFWSDCKLINEMEGDFLFSGLSLNFDIAKLSKLCDKHFGPHSYVRWHLSRYHQILSILYDSAILRFDQNIDEKEYPGLKGLIRYRHEHNNNPWDYLPKDL